MAQHIAALSDLTVVTNSTTIADAIAAMDVAHTISVILTGGVRTPSAALVGPVADRSIASMHVDQLFLGVHGMDARAGFTTPNLAEATTNRALIASAREVIVLADSSKWGVVGLADIAPLSAARTIVTDDALPPDACAHCRTRSRTSSPSRLPSRRRMTIRTDTHLADGRDLFYFDSVAGRDRSAVDLRTDLPAAETSSQMRWNSLFRDYTVIAGHRQTRTYKPPADLCPLCPSSDGRHTEIPAADYEVAVFENRFPSFSLDFGAHGSADRRAAVPVRSGGRAVRGRLLHQPGTTARSAGSNPSRREPSSTPGPTAPPR